MLWPVDDTTDQPRGPGEAPSAATASSWEPPARPQRPGPAPGIEYGGFWIRVGAYLIDAIPLIVIGFILFIPTMTAIGEAVQDLPFPPRGASVNSPEYQAWQALFTERIEASMGGMYPAFGLFQLVSLAYFVGFWTWRGQTPGMMLLGLRVAREADGTNPGLVRSILRYAGYFLSWIALFIGFIWVAFDSRKQGWHDKIAGTVVVRRAG